MQQRKRARNETKPSHRFGCFVGNHEDPKSSVRMLVKTLNDPDQDARNSARLALKRIDPAAAEKAGVK